MGHWFKIEQPGGQVTTSGPPGVHQTLCETLDDCFLWAPDALARTLLEETSVAVYECGVYFGSDDPEQDCEVSCNYFEREEQLTLAEYRAFLLPYLRVAIPSTFPNPETMLKRLSPELRALLQLS